MVISKRNRQCQNHNGNPCCLEAIVRGTFKHSTAIIFPKIAVRSAIRSTLLTAESLAAASEGQNVYPEEIEVKLNNLPYVAESIIVQRGEKFVALIVPNADLLANDGVSAETLTGIMNRNVETLNTQIPTYSQISDYELRNEPFAKTPKGSIKRFMYS